MRYSQPCQDPITCLGPGVFYLVSFDTGRHSVQLAEGREMQHTACSIFSVNISSPARKRTVFFDSCNELHYYEVWLIRIHKQMSSEDFPGPTFFESIVFTAWCSYSFGRIPINVRLSVCSLWWLQTCGRMAAKCQYCCVREIDSLQHKAGYVTWRISKQRLCKPPLTSRTHSFSSSDSLTGDSVTSTSQTSQTTTEDDKVGTK